MGINKHVLEQRGNRLMLARILKLSNYTYSRGHLSFLFYQEQERKDILQQASIVNHPQQASTILQKNYMMR